MVTGGTGYVGAHSVKALVDAGHEVRLLVRDRAKATSTLKPLGVTNLDCVTGDMTDEPSVLKALKGCDAVLHCAAVVSTDRKRADEMLKANPRGAELVIGHAVRLGLDPVVHVSSIAAVLTPGKPVLRADMPLGSLKSGYALSKAEAEKLVRKLQSTGAPVVITYPGSVIGPAAGKVLGEAAGGIAAHLRAGNIPTREAAWSVIDARDLGAIHAALMRKRKGPRRFMCGGHYLTMEQLAALFSELTGRKFPVLGLPGSVLRGLGMVMDAVTRIVPIETVFTHEAMVCFTQAPPTDDSAVGKKLRVRYRDVRETLREAILAVRRAGMVEDEHIGRLGG
jgi:nucleoside-diphosphate-sugar epimerase